MKYYCVQLNYAGKIKIIVYFSCISNVKLIFSCITLLRKVFKSNY